jgi:hypothetical protein
VPNSIRMQKHLQCDLNVPMVRTTTRIRRRAATDEEEREEEKLSEVE